MVGTDHCLEVLVIPVASAREGAGEPWEEAGKFSQVPQWGVPAVRAKLAQGDWEPVEIGRLGGCNTDAPFGLVLAPMLAGSVAFPGSWFPGV